MLSTKVHCLGGQERTRNLKFRERGILKLKEMWDTSDESSSRRPR